MMYRRWMNRMITAMITAAMCCSTGTIAVTAEENSTVYEETDASVSEEINTAGSSENETDNSYCEMPSAPEIPEAPAAPIVEGLDPEKANELINAYNAEIDTYNEKVQEYNNEAGAYEQARISYNENASMYNAEIEETNVAAEEHNKAEEEKVAASVAEQEEYEQKLAKYTETREKYNGYASIYYDAYGEIGRITKDNLEDMGTLLTEDYYIDYGWKKTRQIGKPGDLLVSWDQLKTTGGNTISVVESTEKSGETYKVANLHVYQDFATLSDLDEYYMENGYDCMNIEIDDNNNAFIIPSELLDHIIVLEYDVAEADRNDTVNVTNQATALQKNTSVTAKRFFEDFHGYYWMSSNIFTYTCNDLEDDWAGNHTFSFRDGTSDGRKIKNPLNVNMYSSLYNYSNPVPVKPAEYVPEWKNVYSPKALIEQTAVYLQNLTHMDLIQIAEKMKEIEGEPEEEEKDTDLPASPATPAEPPAPAGPTGGTPSAPSGPTGGTPITPIVPAVPVTVQNTVNTPAVIPEVPAATAGRIPRTVRKKENTVPKAVPQPAVEIEEETVPMAAPQKIIEIEEETVPQAAPAAAPAPASAGAWALVNLICMALSILAALVTAVAFFRSRKAVPGENTEEEPQAERRAAGLLGIIPASAAVLVFMLTEDMTRPMQLTDKWTLLMLVILLITVVIGAAGSKKKNKENEMVCQTA